ncbi:MAG: hypothetical protein M3N35_05300 [Candidatus Binatota bacterium]|nr:hypothetical protein [Candidatus Binatota bacterium]
MDTVVQKAWGLYQHTARFPVETILTTTVWLEEKHRKTPGEKIAMEIALRHDAGMGSATAKEYCARAARWPARACESSAVAPTANATEEN